MRHCFWFLMLFCQRTTLTHYNACVVKSLNFVIFPWGTSSDCKWPAFCQPLTVSKDGWSFLFQKGGQWVKNVKKRNKKLISIVCACVCLPGSCSSPDLGWVGPSAGPSCPGAPPACWPRPCSWRWTGGPGSWSTACPWRDASPPGRPSPPGRAENPLKPAPNFLLVRHWMWTHCEAAEADQHLRLVFQVGGLDGAHQLLLLGQPGVKQALGESGDNRRRDTEIQRTMSRLKNEGGGTERWVHHRSRVLQGTKGSAQKPKRPANNNKSVVFSVSK